MPTLETGATIRRQVSAIDEQTEIQAFSSQADRLRPDILGRLF